MVAAWIRIHAYDTEETKTIKHYHLTMFHFAVLSEGREMMRRKYLNTRTKGSEVYLARAFVRKRERHLAIGKLCLAKPDATINDTFEATFNASYKL